MLSLNVLSAIIPCVTILLIMYAGWCHSAHFVKCCYATILNTFMLSVIILSAIMPSVVAPLKQKNYKKYFLLMTQDTYFYLFTGQDFKTLSLILYNNLDQLPIFDSTKHSLILISNSAGLI